MRKLKLQVQISIDGYVADIHGKTDWLVWNWGSEWNWDKDLKKHFIAITETVDCILLSRKMAVEGFITHWASVAENIDDEQASFARHIAKAKKIVFTKTLKRSVWQNTVLASGELVKEIENLKSQPGDDIIVYGGANFVSDLLQQNLIDEMHLFVNPVALGIGLKIFFEKTKLKLVSCKGFKCGVHVLTYKKL